MEELGYIKVTWFIFSVIVAFFTGVIMGFKAADKTPILKDKDINDKSHRKPFDLSKYQDKNLASRHPYPSDFDDTDNGGT